LNPGTNKGFFLSPKRQTGSTSRWVRFQP